MTQSISCTPRYSIEKRRAKVLEGDADHGADCEVVLNPTFETDCILPPPRSPKRNSRVAIQSSNDTCTNEECCELVLASTQTNSFSGNAHSSGVDRDMEAARHSSSIHSSATYNLKEDLCVKKSNRIGNVSDVKETGQTFSRFNAIHEPRVVKTKSVESFSKEDLGRDRSSFLFYFNSETRRKRKIRVNEGEAGTGECELVLGASLDVSKTSVAASATPASEVNPNFEPVHCLGDDDVSLQKGATGARMTTTTPISGSGRANDEIQITEIEKQEGPFMEQKKLCVKGVGVEACEVVIDRTRATESMTTSSDLSTLNDTVFSTCTLPAIIPLVSRNPFIFLSLSFCIATGVSVLGYLLVGFDVSADLDGWLSRGTLIANQNTQITLINRNTPDLFAGENALWDRLTGEVQPGFTSHDPRQGRRQLVTNQMFEGTAENRKHMWNFFDLPGCDVS